MCSAILRIADLYLTSKYKQLHSIKEQEYFVEKFRLFKWAKGNATSKKGSSKQDVFKSAYNAINSGKPVIVRVTGNGSSGHYITLVGYKDVKNVNSLSASNYLMIDPVSSLFNKGVVSMTAGSTGYSLASSLQYIIVN